MKEDVDGIAFDRIPDTDRDNHVLELEYFMSKNSENRKYSLAYQVGSNPPLLFAIA
jgi:hypothetical protein